MSQRLLQQIESIQSFDRNKFDKIINQRAASLEKGRHMFEVRKEVRVPNGTCENDERGPRNGSCLLEAHELINNERQDYYGPPAESFGRIAQMWSAYLGIRVKAEDVCTCMALLKIGREAHEHDHDNLTDAAGYIGLACDLAEALG